MDASRRKVSPPVVFISYAHESAAFRGSVKALADWLGTNGCDVLTDHEYAYRPPEEGWQAWMLGCINRADTVLVVCTPRLKARYEKTEFPEIGFGGTYEGAIITQRIYDDQMRNTKFYPVLPDEGTLDHVPTTLKPWWNGHRFPSGNESIRRMIFNEPGAVPSYPDAEEAAVLVGSATSQCLDSHHHRLAIKLLSKAGAKPFLDALKSELAEEFPDKEALPSPDAVVKFFANCPAHQVQQLFYTVRRALHGASPATQDLSTRQDTEGAAAALYCIAACRLVNIAAFKAVSGSNRYVLQVPSSERVVCAVVATALFGGELRFRQGKSESGFPCPEFVFEVTIPAVGDQIVESLERAIYVAVFPEKQAAIDVSLDSGPLDNDKRAELKVHLNDIKHVKRASLALVISGLAQTDVCEGFANQYQVPVMLPNRDVAEALLGMDADMLKHEIKKFWDGLEALPSSTQRLVEEPRDIALSYSCPPQSSGTPPMPKSDIKIEVSGGTAQIALTTGGYSAAQTGSNNVANIVKQAHGEIAQLMPLFQELLVATYELPRPETRDSLSAHVEAAQTEAAKAHDADAGLIKRSLESVKSIGEALEGGEKIVDVCTRALALLAPFIQSMA